MTKLEIHGLTLVVSKLQNLGGGFATMLDSILERSMTLDVWPLWMTAIGLTDHTLRDLAEMGYPYRLLNGKDSGPHPDWMVHAQTDQLIEGSRIESSLFERSLVNTAPEYVDLRYGTSKMRIRDPGAEVLQQALPKIKQRFATEAKGLVVKFWGS